jgi:hypothetical protein
MGIGVGATKTVVAPRIDPSEALRTVQHTMQTEDINLLKVTYEIIYLITDRPKLRISFLGR